MGVGGVKSALLLDICRALGATAYLSGVSGRAYLQVDRFREAGIAVRFQEFHHPIYRQCFGPFVPCMSALDLLFLEGTGSLRCLTGAETPRLQEVFV